MDNFISTMVLTIYEQMQTIAGLFNKSINLILANNGIELEVPVVGEWSVFGLMFGGGLILFVGYTFVKWVLDIIL